MFYINHCVRVCVSFIYIQQFISLFIGTLNQYKPRQTFGGQKQYNILFLKIEDINLLAFLYVQERLQYKHCWGTLRFFEKCVFLFVCFFWEDTTVSLRWRRLIQNCHVLRHDHCGLHHVAVLLTSVVVCHAAVTQRAHWYPIIWTGASAFKSHT